VYHLQQLLLRSRSHRVVIVAGIDLEVTLKCSVGRMRFTSDDCRTFK